MFFSTQRFRAFRWIKERAKRMVPNQVWQTLKRRSEGIIPSRSDFESALLAEWIAARRTESPVGEPLAEGITLVGYLSAATGLGEAARSSLRAIQAAGIPYSLVDLDFDVPDRQRIPHPAPEAPTGFLHRINLLHLNPNHLPYLWEKFGARALLGRRTIGVWYWELPAIPEEWVPAFQVVDEIWAPSRFVLDAIQTRSPVPVHLVPPCIEVEYDPALTRADFGLPSEAFLFLCAYDVNSVQARKNPEGAIEAFRRAFEPNDPSVGLVIKINNAEEDPPGVARLEETLRGAFNVYFIKQILPREQLNSLLNLCDAYVSLHRSEGFGLVAAEAMYLGKPVIATNWSGNTDFMNAENSMGVNYTLVPVGETQGPYEETQFWAEPDVDEASKLFYYLKNDKRIYLYLSQNGKETIMNSFDLNQFSNMLLSLL